MALGVNLEAIKEDYDKLKPVEEQREFGGDVQVTCLPAVPLLQQQVHLNSCRTGCREDGLHTANLGLLLHSARACSSEWLPADL